MAESNYETVEIYTDLRNQALQLKPDFFGLKDAEQSRVIAILMEMGRANANSALDRELRNLTILSCRESRNPLCEGAAHGFA